MRSGKAKETMKLFQALKLSQVPGTLEEAMGGLPGLRRNPSSTLPCPVILPTWAPFI